MTSFRSTRYPPKGEHAIHAEAIALRRTGGNLVDCLVVARLTQRRDSLHGFAM